MLRKFSKKLHVGVVETTPQRKRKANTIDQPTVNAVHVSHSGTRKRLQGSSVNTKGLKGGDDKSTQERIKDVLCDRMNATNNSSRRAFNRPRANKKQPTTQSTNQTKKVRGNNTTKDKSKSQETNAPGDALNQKIFAFVSDKTRERIDFDEENSSLNDGLSDDEKEKVPREIRSAAYLAVRDGMLDSEGKKILGELGLVPNVAPVLARDDEYDPEDPNILSRNPNTVIEAEALKAHATSLRSGNASVSMPEFQQQSFEIKSFNENSTSWDVYYDLLKKNAEEAVLQLDDDHSEDKDETGMPDDPSPPSSVASSSFSSSSKPARKKALPRGSRGKALEVVPEHAKIDPTVLLRNDILLEVLQNEVSYSERLCTEVQRRMMAQDANKNVSELARLGGPPVGAPIEDPAVRLKIPSEREQYEGTGFAPYEMNETHFVRLLTRPYGNFLECICGTECVAAQWWAGLGGPLMGAIPPEEFESKLRERHALSTREKTRCVVCESHLVLRTAMIQMMRDGACVTVRPAFYFLTNSQRGGYTTDGGILKRQTIHDENPASTRADRPSASYENCGGMTTAFRVFQRTSFSIVKRKVRYMLHDGAWMDGEVTGLIEDNPPLFTVMDAIKPPTRYLRPLCFVSRRPAARQDGEYDVFKILCFEFMLHQDALGTISAPQYAEMANMAFVPGRGSESRVSSSTAFSSGNTTLAIMFPSNKTSTSTNSVLHLRRKQQTRKRAPSNAAKVKKLRKEQLAKLGEENIREDDFLATFGLPEQQDLQYTKTGPVSVEYWMRAVSKETFETFSAREISEFEEEQEIINSIMHDPSGRRRRERPVHKFMGAERANMPFDAVFQADLRVTATRLPELLCGMRLWLTHVRSCRLFNYTIDLTTPLSAFAQQLDPNPGPNVSADNALLGKFFAPRRLYLAYIIRQTLIETLLVWFHRPTKPNNPRIYKRLKAVQDWDMENYYHLFRESMAGATAGTQWVLNPNAPLDVSIPDAYFDEFVLRKQTPCIPLATDKLYVCIDAELKRRQVPRERLFSHYMETFSERTDNIPQLIRAAFVDEFDCVRYSIERGKFLNMSHVRGIWDLVIGKKTALYELDQNSSSIYQNTTVCTQSLDETTTKNELNEVYEDLPFGIPEASSSEGGEEETLRGILWSCLTQTIRVGSATGGIDAQRELEWAESARAICELEFIEMPHSEFCSNYSVLWLLFARMFAVEWLAKYEEIARKVAEKNMLVAEQRYLFAVSKHSDMTAEAREVARNNWKAAENSFLDIKRRMHDLYTYAYSHYRLLLRTLDGCLLSNANFYEFVPSVCASLVDENGDPLPNPKPRKCSFLTHYEECQPHDTLSLHEGMLPDMGTMVLNIEFILPPLITQSDSQARASGGFMGVTKLVLEQVSRLHGIAKKLLPRLFQVRDANELHSANAPQNVAYMHMTRIAFQLTMLGGFEHSEERMPLLKGLNIFADTAFGVSNDVEASARMLEEQTSCNALYTLCLTIVLVFYIEQIPTYEDFILLNYPTYAQYKRSVRHKATLARCMYERGVTRQEISQFMKEKDMFMNRSILQTSATHIAFFEGFQEQHSKLAEMLRKRDPKYVNLATALTSHSVIAARTRRATQPLKEHIHRPSIDNVVRTLRNIIDNIDLKRRANGYIHAKLPYLVSLAIRMRVRALRPNQPIVLVQFLLEFNEFVDLESPSLLFHPSSSLIVWWVLDMLEAAENIDIIEAGLNLMSPVCWAVFSQVIRALHAHYSISVLLLPDHIARKQIAAVRRRFHLMHPDPRSTSITITTCCNRFVSFHASQSETSAHTFFGQSNTTFIPFGTGGGGKIVCSAKTTPTRAPVDIAVSNILEAYRVGDVDKVRSLLAETEAAVSNPYGEVSLCGTEPVSCWPTVGYVVLCTEARGRIVSYSCCTLCGSNMGFSVTNYVDGELICNSCSRDDLAKQQTPSCVACGQIMKGNMTLSLSLGLFNEPKSQKTPHHEQKLKLWRQFWVFHDTPSDPFYTFRRVFVCHTCINVKPSGAIKLSCFDHPSVISYASDIPRIRRNETWLDIEVRVGKLDACQLISDFYSKHRLDIK